MEGANIKTAPMKVFRWLFMLVALVLLAVDYYMSQRGVSLCPYQGCKVVAHTPFAVLLGKPLTLWGMAFFVLGFVLSFSESLLFLLFSVGVGFSLYMVYLQAFVIGKLCQLCLLVEAVVFLVFLTLLSDRRMGSAFVLVLLGFLGTHALYTFPPAYADAALEAAATYTGNGSVRAAFFFDPMCPACEKAYGELVKHKGLFARLTFKCIAAHEGSFERARLFYGLCLSGESPWKAFEVVHSGKRPGVEKPPAAKVKGVTDANLKGLQALGIDAVPVLVVDEGVKKYLLVGYEELKEWLLSRTSPPATSPLFVPLEGGVCTPKRCD